MSWIKKFLPKSLLGRSLVIIVTPLVLLQVISATIFFEAHWDKVSRRLARGLAGDIATVIDLLGKFRGEENRQWIFHLAGITMGLEMDLKKGAILPNAPSRGSGLIEASLNSALNSNVGRPFQIDTRSRKNFVKIQVQLSTGVLDVVVSRKRLFSTTTYVFVFWMVGTSLVLFGVAILFMRNQVKPIRRLAQAADDLGKGRDVMPGFKPEGAKEVRLAASAFLAMRERILRQIGQRTEMLAGVSHDLKTPLTRMKLQLELLDDKTAVGNLKQDIGEMEHMLQGYLAFARGEGTEAPKPVDLSALLTDVVSAARRRGGDVDLHSEGSITATVRPNAFRRCVTNVVDNACRYADHVSVRAGRRSDVIEITIDDDGPGIPLNRREDAFKPFYRLEASRNPGTGGVGLGLTIARDIVRSHGGDIKLSDSPAGGLRARLTLPL